MRCGAGRGRPVRAPGAGAQPKVLEVLTMCDFASDRSEENEQGECAVRDFAPGFLVARWVFMLECAQT